MTEKDVVNAKTEITEIVKNIFSDIDKFLHNGNESAGIRTRKNIIKLSKITKKLRLDMLKLSNLRKQHKHIIKKL